MKQARRIFTLTALSVFAWHATPSQGAERAVVFKPGATATTLKGTLRGDADATFVLTTGEGQALKTRLTASNRSCTFNVFEPGRDDEAAHIGSVAGNDFARDPAKAGTYRFQIYLMRNAARRGETCRYSLSIALAGKTGGAGAAVSDREMRDRCRARVAEMYASPSARIRLAGTRTDKDGPLINGTVDKGAEGIKAFRCLYTPERQLRDVMAMTPDGE